MKYGYLAVEGPHDSAFVGSFLKFYGLSLVREISEIKGTFFEELTRINFPVDGDLLKRIPVPMFFKKGEDILIAISCASSDDKLVDDVTEMVISLLPEDLDGIEDFSGIGIVADMDSPSSPLDRFNEFADGLKKLKLPHPTKAGKVATGPLNTGIFILPDNENTGTLEDILIPCAEIVYPNLLNSAQELVEKIDINSDEFKKRDKKELKKPAGPKKATINIIGSVLKPGKAIQVSIQDNRWISDETRKLPQIANFDSFLKTLFEL